ncbi:MAG: hypothetical protein AVDCRST_MAG85-3754 [uncultured Solirubrobacteraceae bacterium]|uniref:Uncharacterized protein n=1 Tax=uncultured Solirubrobacteraceae bacterium TaxID=1162706 RepID=A0A6J4TW07_9ACTN|nr:MAG: hypothetical protein AVDCRST_MAG85-3754 [uncultured Solirubrobacteraceae bacterium]
MTDRRDLLRLVGFLAALLVVTGAIVLATSGGSKGDDGPRAAGGAQTLDGIVMEVDAVKLVLRPATGGENVTFEIRAVDQPNFDVFHLQQHAADGLNTRVTYLQDGTRRYALRADDAPEPNVP